MSRKIHLFGFTILELIVVITILALFIIFAIIVINSNSIFKSIRDSTRSSNLQELKGAFSRYIADTPNNGSTRKLSDFTGYTTLYAQATILNQNSTPTYSSRCPGGSYGNGLDNVNGNRLVLYAPNTENTSPKYTLLDDTYPTSNIMVWDGFNRPNANKLGTTDTSNTWNVGGGGPIKVIQGNNAFEQNASYGISYITSSISDGTIKTTFQSTQDIRLIFRLTDTNNYWYVGSLNGSLVIVKMVSGSPNLVYITNAPSVVVNDIVEVIMLGSSINVKLNGTSYYTVNDNFNISAMGYGIQGAKYSTWGSFLLTI